jgi:hypothetical protein
MLKYEISGMNGSLLFAVKLKAKYIFRIVTMFNV